MLAIVSHLNWRQNSFGTILSLITSLSISKRYTSLWRIWYPSYQSCITFCHRDTKFATFFLVKISSNGTADRAFVIWICTCEHCPDISRPHSFIWRLRCRNLATSSSAVWGQHSCSSSIYPSDNHLYSYNDMYPFSFSVTLVNLAALSILNRIIDFSITIFFSFASTGCRWRDKIKKPSFNLRISTIRYHPLRIIDGVPWCKDNRS